MADNDWKKRLGVVFSTNPDFQYEHEADVPEDTTPEPSKQHLIVRLDRHARAGKQVTIVDGFKGAEEDLNELGRSVKVKLGVGGSVKEGQIVIQGDFRDRICTLLTSLGYNTKRGN